MQIDFPDCLKFTLLVEGGWSSNPNDPGGDTMQGITLAVYREWNDDPNTTADQLRNISAADVSAIYEQSYWDKVQGDQLAAGVDLSVFDMQVNSGSNSAKILQATVGVTVDGNIGPITLAATNKINPATLINALAVHQEAFYRSLADFQYFGNGWINRTVARKAAALRMTGSQIMAKATNPPEHFFELIKSII